MSENQLIDRLLGTVGARQFLCNYWPNSLVWGEGSSVYEAITPELEEIIELDAFLPRQNSRVRLYTVREGRYQKGYVYSDELKRVSGVVTWSLEWAQNYCPTIKSLISELEHFLSLPPDRISATVFVSRAGAGLPWHFDPVEVLVVPLLGTKSWFLKTNTSIKFPSNTFVASPGPSGYGQSATTMDGRPIDVPRVHDDFWAAKTGSVLFLPRGWWHKTEASTASVSLSLTLDTPTVMDVLLNQLRNLLKVKEDWREPACGDALERTGFSRIWADIRGALGGTRVGT